MRHWAPWHVLAYVRMYAAILQPAQAREVILVACRTIETAQCVYACDIVTPYLTASMVVGLIPATLPMSTNLLARSYKDSPAAQCLHMNTA